MKRVLFLIFSVVLLASFAIAMWQDTFREWAATQWTLRRTLHGEERRSVPSGIQQLWVTNLGRVDRCTTCHLAIDKPQIALGEEPFTAHPGKYLEWHPVEKFGCTVCHGGQGLATEASAAHGDVKHWEEPLLRGELVQASCRSCHGDVATIAQEAPKLAQGHALFQAAGCYGCHAIKDFGQSVSVDLAEVGSKSYLLMEADLEMMGAPHDRIHWLMTKLEHPRVLNPGVPIEQLPSGEEEVFPSAMPRFGFSHEEAEALTVYLLSLTDEDVPASYMASMETKGTRPALVSPIEQGRWVFERYGCAGCHGTEGLGGRSNWNAGLGGEVPSLIYVKAYYENHVEALKDLIRSGRQPVPRADAARPAPSLYMPAWKDKISEDDLHVLVAYLFSLAEYLPTSAALESSASVPSIPPQ